MCSTNKSFSNGKKWVVKSGNLNISALAKGKTYYVKARAYKTDSTGKKVYGSFSAIKKISMGK